MPNFDWKPADNYISAVFDQGTVENLVGSCHRISHTKTEEKKRQ